MTSREQAAGGESVPNPRHCTKILTGRRGGVAGGGTPTQGHLTGTPHFVVEEGDLSDGQYPFLERRGWEALSPSAYPSMTPREQAAGEESVPNPRHCTKILTGGRGGVAGGKAPVQGHL